MDDQQGTLPGLWDDLDDLPRSWDGESVTWDEEWKTVGVCIIHTAPGFEDECDRCGYRGTSPTKDGYVRRLTAYRNSYGQIQRRWVQTRALTAFRCPGCAHDVVVDADLNAWDLGPEDYGTRGSHLVDRKPPVRTPTAGSRLSGGEIRSL